MLVDVKASGLCHSDYYVATTEIGQSLPAVLGHEVSGVVIEVGANVVGFAAGDHVVACLAGFCGRCDRCLSGRSNLCRNYPAGTQRSPGDRSRLTLGGEAIAQFSEVSGFAERVLLHQNNAVVIPHDVPFPQAAILGCGVTTGAGSAIRSAGVRVGEDVAVIGCGGVGLNTIQGAALAGARKVIAVDIQPTKLELASTKFGATHTVNAADQDAVEAVRELTAGGVDHAFEVIGGIPRTLEQAVEMLAPGGTAYIVGAQPPTSALAMPAANFLFQKTGLRGVFMGSTNFKVDIPLYAELYLQGRFNLDDLISRTIRLDEINEAYADLAGGNVARSMITSF
ncbi:Zn-dependent alcohol dehydrogenase [Mycolicibacterium madagascariense]|uniref:Zn-dependent alcohol dehydrogenase n=1 Tax=Mycolicibacterium madagascariense TaxID=212765 RepID=UPI002ADE6A62|nr:Zn-dependent alcohol dehydrogenase [Mycolicibacterium madagascariense]